jgi:hypothetical protein
MAVSGFLNDIFKSIKNLFVFIRLSYTSFWEFTTHFFFFKTIAVDGPGRSVEHVPKKGFSLSSLFCVFLFQMVKLVA